MNYEWIKQTSPDFKNATNTQGKELEQAEKKQENRSKSWVRPGYEREGIFSTPKRVRRLMHEMGLKALSPCQ